jgi:tagatose-6-phosphate ketose/aldose isomerase
MEKKFCEQPISYYEERDCLHTVTEILQQPQVWRKLADDLRSRKDEITTFMNEVMAIPNLRIITAGAGSSAFVGEVMQYLIANEMKLEIESIHTTDIISAPQAVLFDRPTLMISYARSGESPESTAAVAFAQKKIKNLYQIIIVCDKNSSLAKVGQDAKQVLVLDMPAESCDKGFAMTSSVSCMALATWCVFHYQEMEDYTKYICVLADSAEQELEQLGQQAQAIAATEYRRLIWLGTGALKGLAREASIKSMELSDGYIHAGYDAPTGFRHGPKTVVNEETMTIHFFSNLSYSLQYDIDFAKEMIRERGKNKVVIIKPDQCGEALADADATVSYQLPKELPPNSEMGAYIKSLLFSQLLSMFKSLEQGFATDNPCPAGDVNRVVQGIIIYNI